MFEMSSYGRNDSMASEKIKRIHEQMAQFNKTADGIQTELLLDFADIVIWQLRKQNLKQKDLADRVGMKESQITRIIQASGNPTFATLSKIMEALGIEVKLLPKHGKPFEEEKTSEHHGQEKSTKFSISESIRNQPAYREFRQTHAKRTSYRTSAI